MTDQATTAYPRLHGLWRSMRAVLLGFFAIAVLSYCTEMALRLLQVYPLRGQPMHDPSLNLLALAYRIVYGVFGCYLAARCAPYAPMRHAMAVGVIQFVLGLNNAITALPLNLGPAWYPTALWLAAWPCAWLGGVLHSVTHTERQTG